MMMPVLRSFVLIAAGAMITTVAADDGDILEREVVPADVETTVTIERIIYESGGLRILGYLAYPEEAPELDEPLPCLVFNRGGNRDFGAFTPEQFTRFAVGTADWGYVLFASNYRGSTGSEGSDEFGGADVNDVVNAIRIFDQLDFADGERIGMWGHSRGGMMTYIALKKTDRIDAAIIGAGPAEWKRAVVQRPAMESRVLAECVPDWEVNRDREMKARSAIEWADDLPDDVPILLVHGTADWRVDPRDSMEMSIALYEAKKPFRLIMLEGADHSMSEFRQTYSDEVRAWLDRYVRDGGPLPNLEPHGE